MAEKLTIDELATFCKRKGFVFRSSEIYGGFSGFWDFGPLGVELYNNIKNSFWKFFVQQKDNIVGIENSIISHPRIWKASGHLASFNDLAVICKRCKKATKIDKSDFGKVKCGCGGEYQSLGEFSLMFKTQVGALSPTESYLRGENAQGMFTDFRLVQETSRMGLPFGIAQIGKCFRNEIAPRDFLFRSREFTIAEFEFFIRPEEKNCPLLDEKHKKIKVRLLDAKTPQKKKETIRETTIGEMANEKKLDEWHAYWLSEQLLWFSSLGISNKIKIREHTKSELSHYSSATFDLDYEYPFGSKEIAGNANRGQFDLTQHMKESGENLSIFDEKTKKRIVPRVIEPTFGIERIFLALLCESYNYDKKRENVVLKLPAFLAPIKAAVFPIVKNEKMIEIAEKLVKELKEDFNVIHDDSGSIGRRYSRNDEIGTPMCITIDEQTVKDKTITIRDRDTTEQVRVQISQIKNIINQVIKGESLLSLGKLVKTRVK
ncbi:glycine--tRNA ligase [Candidatus Pacearchaeota archaeon]|nr:glycine--tRNA ligase [Candidatus Pacearchaeota archaeon]